MQVKFESKETNIYVEISLLRTVLLPKEGEDSMGPINVWEMSPYDQHPEYKAHLAADVTLFQGTIWDQVLLWYHSELAAYFGDCPTAIRDKLRTELQIASSNLKYIYIFKCMYFKCISFSSQQVWGKKESRVKALESFARVCNKLISSISNSNFIKSKCQWDCNDSRAAPSNSVGGLEMAQHPALPIPTFPAIKGS